MLGPRCNHAAPPSRSLDHGTLEPLGRGAEGRGLRVRQEDALQLEDVSRGRRVHLLVWRVRLWWWRVGGAVTVEGLPPVKTKGAQTRPGSMGRPEATGGTNQPNQPRHRAH